MIESRDRLCNSRGFVPLSVLLGVLAWCAIAATTDQILNKVYDSTNTALRVNLVAGGSGGGTGSGDVVGPGSSTDNAVVRFDGTTGKLVQNSVCIVSDTGDETGLNSTSLTTFAAVGGDPADSGAVRLANAACVSFEASPAGTDVCGITVDASENVVINGTTTVQASGIVTGLIYNAEGSGNLLTMPVTVDFKAAGCNNATAAFGWDTPTTSAPTSVCLGTTGLGALRFADGSTTTAQTSFHLPVLANVSNSFDVVLTYTGDTSSTNNIRWSIALGCTADGESVSAPSYNTATATNSAGPATTPNRKVLAVTGLSVTNCAAGETMFVQLQRVGADAGDTYAGNADALDLELTYRKAI
jgi:hypothetical protein